MIDVDDVLFSHKTDIWTTPLSLLDKLTREHGELFDPCPLNPTFDGLKIEWKNVNFVNPPYSDWSAWVEKGFLELGKGRKTIFLLPARTDTKAFHKYIWDASRDRPYPYAEVKFIPGRLKFGGSKNSAPFPSMIVIFNPIRTTGEKTYLD